MKLHLKKVLITCIITCNYASHCNQEAPAWSEFSVILKPSPLGGIGIFATHDIPTGTQVFTQEFKPRKAKIKDIPTEFMKYCIYINDEECLCPEHFDRMEIGWYMNHSDDPNIGKKEKMIDVVNDIQKRDDYAIKDIKAGDEILIDYNCLTEPEHLKEDYYK